MSQGSLLRIAIDGPAGAGKSTVAQQVAQKLGYTYIDTGAMYRAFAWAILDRGVAPDDTAAVCRVSDTVSIRLQAGEEATRVFVDEQDVTADIRSPEISNLTSPLSALACVRRRMVALQQQMGAKGGVVMEGRDIGTVVLPEAEVKVFLTASLEERARRRQAELAGRGTTMSLDELRQDILERDSRDGSRDVAPMVPASDAVIIDSDRVDVDSVVDAVLTLSSKARFAHVS